MRSNGHSHASADDRTLGHILVTFRVSQEDGQFTSECVELGTASCGDTIEEALDGIMSATELYLDTLQAEGQRERVFEERGIALLLASKEIKQGPLLAEVGDIVSLRVLDVPRALSAV